MKDGLVRNASAGNCSGFDVGNNYLVVHSDSSALAERPKERKVISFCQSSRDRSIQRSDATIERSHGGNDKTINTAGDNSQARLNWRKAVKKFGDTMRAMASTLISGDEVKQYSPTYFGPDRRKAPREVYSKELNEARTVIRRVSVATTKVQKIYGE